MGSIPITRSNPREHWPMAAKAVCARRCTEMLAHVGRRWLPLHTQPRGERATAEPVWGYTI